MTILKLEIYPSKFLSVVDPGWDPISKNLNVASVKFWEQLTVATWVPSPYIFAVLLVLVMAIWCQALAVKKLEVWTRLASLKAKWSVASSWWTANHAPVVLLPLPIPYP